MTDIDISVCENEPIRYPGAVMPHGVLLVLRAGPTSVIDAVSESCLPLLGLKPDDLLGATVGELFGAAAAAALANAPGDGRRPVLRLTLNGRDLLARTSTNQAGQTLVDIQPPVHRSAEVYGILHESRGTIDGLRRMTDLPSLTAAVTDAVRGLTGFERVMIYRFDEAWNGEVIAEARGEDIEPYLGLSFPAGDIPRQARDLFQACRLRLIPDVDYAPSALVAGQDARTLDLGQSALRSVSPIHIEYLKNMGVRASLVGALVVDGGLWGLLACHQISGPKYFAPDVLETLEWLCLDIAAQIEVTLIRQRQERVDNLARRRQKLVEVVRSSDFKSLMHADRADDLLNVVGADGFALITDQRIQTVGSTPAIERIRALQRRRGQSGKGPTLFASTDLSGDLGLAAGDGVVGAIFVAVREKPAASIIWFRKERRHSIRWAGAPGQSHPADQTGRILPRKSFAQFLETVGGRCLPWDPEELASAAELGALMQIELLRKSEALALTAMMSMHEQLAVLDSQGVIVAVNKAWERFAEENGAPDLARQSVGLSYRAACEAAGGQSGAKVWAGIESVLNRQADHFTLDYPCHSPSGQRWFQMTVTPMMAPEEGGVVVHQELTQRKRLEAKLQRSEERFRSLIEGTTDWVWETDANHCFSWSSESFEHVIGFSFDKIIGRQRWDLASPEHDIDAAQWQAFKEDLDAHRNFRDFRYWMHNSDGHPKWISVSGSPRFDDCGNFLGYGGSGSDITATAETAVRLKLLSTVVEQSPISVLITDPQGIIEYANPHFTTASGYPLAEVLGKNPRLFASGETPREVYDDLWKTIAAGRRWTGDLLNRRKDGELRWQQAIIAPIQDDAGKIIHYVSIEEDTTERRKIEDDLRRTNKELEQFAYVASHDLRQPLRMVSSYLDIIEKRLGSQLDGELRTFFGHAAGGARKMDRLIADLLEYSRTGNSAEPTLVALSEVVAEAIQHLTVAVQDAGAVISVAAGLPSVMGDPSELTRLFQNLIGNAIKYRSADRPPKVEIGFGRQANRHLVWVRDNGMGIAPENCQRAFQIFQRLVARDAYEGTGIGLAVCKKIVEHCGGTIWIESVVGEGSSFFMTFPRVGG